MSYPNIVLTGMRCSGKSLLGRLLAKKINWNFVDTDEHLEHKAGQRIRHLVAAEGWEHFRNLEHEACVHIHKLKKTVISLGGGAITFEHNAQLFEKSLIVFLEVPLEILAERLEKERSNRPHLADDDALVEMKQMWAERKNIYLKTANVIVKCAHHNPQKNLQNLLTEVNKYIKI